MNPVFSQIKAQNITTLLTKLSQLNSDCYLQKGEKRAAVAIYLNQGTVLFGWPLNVDGTAQSGWNLSLKITERSDDFESHSDIAYIPLHHISALKILNNLHLIDILTGGSSVPQFNEPEIPRLQAKRKSEELKNKLYGKELDIRWDHFPEKAFSNNFILKFLSLIIDYMDSLTKDAVGLSAIESFSKIVLEPSNSDRLTARKMDKLLIVGIPYSLIEMNLENITNTLNQSL